MLMNSRAERLFETDPANDEQFARIVQANDTKFTTLISDFFLQTEDRRVENLILQDPESSEELPVEVVSSKITDQRGQVTAIVSVRMSGPSSAWPHGLIPVGAIERVVGSPWSLMALASGTVLLALNTWLSTRPEASRSR